MKFIIFRLVSYLYVSVFFLVDPLSIFVIHTIKPNFLRRSVNPVSCTLLSARQTAHETINVNLYKGTGTASLFHWSCLLVSLFADPETAINVGSPINQGDNINEGQKQELSSQGQDGKPIRIIARWQKKKEGKEGKKMEEDEENWHVLTKKTRCRQDGRFSVKVQKADKRYS